WRNSCMKSTGMKTGVSWKAIWYFQQKNESKINFEHTWLLEGKFMKPCPTGFDLEETSKTA
ncbi:MAG: hypothetical protein VYE57_07255, partial [SAR324 cluster bacterium]|nr:hypothetical protein [SAR324 cluster bacterium]